MVSRQQKEAVVTDLKTSLGAASVVVIADYRGLSNAEMTALRRALRPNNARLTVAKNTLVKLAVKDSDMESLVPDLKGPTALLLGEGDQVAAVKALRDFLKKNKKKNELRAAFLDGAALNASDVDALAELPPLEELRGKLVMCLASPMNRLVQALQGPQSAFVRALSQVAEQKEKAAS